MRSERAKRHHYVPKALQKAFCFEGERIWYSEKKEGKFTSPEIRNIDKAFVERNRNTVLIDGAPSDVVERDYYGPLDNFLGSFFVDILKSFENGKTPVVVGDTLEMVKDVLVEMIKRSPDYVRRPSDLEIGRRIVSDEISKNDTTNDGSKTEALNEVLRTDYMLTQLGRDVRTRATILRTSLYDELMPLLKDRSIRWAVSKGKHSFIVSSRMCYRIGNGGVNGFINPNSEVWFPISPKICLVLVRDPEQKIPYVIEDTSHHVRLLNEFALENSQAIASHSRELICSLLRIKHS